MDAIVNAANSSLLGGGGVDGAIHRAGGPSILEECRAIRATTLPRGLAPGEAVATTGGDLSATRVIHTVGPVWHGGKDGEREVLQRAYVSALRIAVAEKLSSIAFPSISTGAYGYPIELAADAAIEAVRTFIDEDDSLDEVRFVLHSRSDYELFMAAFGAA